MGRSWRPTDPAKVCHHQQSRDRRTSIHPSHQELDNRRTDRSGYICLQAAGECEEGRIQGTGRNRRSPIRRHHRSNEMTRRTQRLLTIVLATAAGIGCLFVSDRISLTTLDSLVTTADARIGRPATPMSYAGVARRTTARAVGVGVAVGAAAVVAAPRCRQVVDAYGRIVTVC